MARLFFALQPQQGDLDRLARALPQDLGARRVIPSDNLHVTLAFLGDLDAEQEGAARQAADGVRAPAFALSFVSFAYWPRPRVRVLLPDTVPAAAQALRGDLACRLRELAVPFEARIWRPHLTVARKADPAGDLSLEPITVGFREFVLMHSRTDPAGARYVVIGRWPLHEQPSP